jgi:hypothetical protein
MANIKSGTAATPRPAEEVARDVVLATLSNELGLPVEAEHWDVPPRQGVHDFWITYGTTREALEVTTFAEEIAITQAMHWRKRGPGFSTTVAGLSSAWSILVDHTFKADQLTSNLEAWLLALEKERIAETGRWDSERVYVHPITTAMAATGVMKASAVPGPPAGLVDLAYASTGPSRPAGDPNHIARALSDILTLERHRADTAKLGRSGVDQRHLFLWVDLTRFDVMRAFDEGVPTVPPAVDPNITVIWLAIPTETGADVLRWSATNGWRRGQVTV